MIEKDKTQFYTCADLSRVAENLGWYLTEQQAKERAADWTDVPWNTIVGLLGRIARAVESPRVPMREAIGTVRIVSRYEELRDQVKASAWQTFAANAVLHHGPWPASVRWAIRRRWCTSFDVWLPAWRSGDDLTRYRFEESVYLFNEGAAAVLDTYTGRRMTDWQDYAQTLRWYFQIPVGSKRTKFHKEFNAWMKHSGRRSKKTPIPS